MGNLFSSRKTVAITSGGKSKKKKKETDSDVADAAVITSAANVVNGGPEKPSDVAVAEIQTTTPNTLSVCSAASGTSDGRPSSSRVSELNFKDAETSRFFQEVMNSVGELQVKGVLNEEDERNHEPQLSENRDKRQSKDATATDVSQSNPKVAENDTLSHEGALGENNAKEEEKDEVKKVGETNKSLTEDTDVKEVKKEVVDINVVEADTDNTGIASVPTDNVTTKGKESHDGCADKDKENETNEDKKENKSGEQVQESINGDKVAECIKEGGLKSSGVKDGQLEESEKKFQTAAKGEENQSHHTESANTGEPKNTQDDRETIEAEPVISVEPVLSGLNDQLIDKDVPNDEASAGQAKPADKKGGTHDNVDVKAANAVAVVSSSSSGDELSDASDDGKDVGSKDTADVLRSGANESPKLDEIVEEVRRSFLYLDQLDDLEDDLEDGDITDVTSTDSDEVIEDPGNTLKSKDDKAEPDGERVNVEL